MRRPVSLLILMLALSALNACGAPAAGTPATTTAAGNNAAPVELNIFAAASLIDAFKEIAAKFEAANSGTKLTFNFAGSQQLAQQIGQGAPVDVFASANQKQMDVVVEAGQVIDGTQHIFVRNRLVVIYPKDNPARPQALKDLARPGLKLDLAAKEVPVGQYALDFLDKASKDVTYGAGFKDAVLKNVVSYEANVKAVLSKVSLGEADAGIVYSSDIGRDATARVGRLDIPDPLNTIATYPIAPIRDSKHADLAKKFVDYVLSPEGQTILANYGFISTAGAAGGSARDTWPTR
jgi:molybdate transport system substrate-binding protein